jgi:hypothetical protein
MPWVSMQPWSWSTAVVGAQDDHCVCTCVRVGERVLATSASITKRISQSAQCACASRLSLSVLVRTRPQYSALARHLSCGLARRDAGKFDGAASGGIGIKGGRVYMGTRLAAYYLNLRLPSVEHSLLNHYFTQI